MGEQAPTRVWNKRFVHLVFIELLLQFGIYSTTPIASNYAVTLGASIGVAGFITGQYSAFALCMRPFTGWITDHFAKKSLLIAAGLLFAASGIGCAFAPTLEVMGVFRSLLGIAFALKSVIVVSFAAFVVPQENVGSAVGWVSVAGVIASALGPTAGSMVGDAVGYSYSFLLAGCLAVAGLVLTILFKVPEAAQQVENEREAKLAALAPEERRFKFDIKEFFFLPAFIPSILGGTIVICFSIIGSFLIMVSAERSIEGASIYFILYAACAFFSRPAAGTLLDKKGFTWVFFPAVLFMSLSPAILMFADNAIWVAVAGMIMGTGHASAYAAAQAFSAKIATPETMGRAVNTFYVGPDLAMAFGPMLGGFVYQLAGSQAMFGCCVAACLLDFVLALVFKTFKKI